VLRFAVLMALATASIVLVSCCRPWQTAGVDPPRLPARSYGQGIYSPNAHDRAPRHQNSYPSSSGQYEPEDAYPSDQYEPAPSSGGYEPQSSSNPLGPVTSQRRYDY
jgi:hypothetical protein